MLGQHRRNDREYRDESNRIGPGCDRGHVGRLNIAYDGSVSGTITHDTRIIGRFEGSVSGGLRFKTYQIESGDK